MRLAEPLTPAQLEAYASNLGAFIEDVLGQTLYPKQREIAESVSKNKGTLVPSCHSAGKTNLAGRLVLAWLLTHPYSAVVTTAPTLRQVTRLLWKEVRAAYRNSRIEIGGDLLPKAPTLEIDGDQWIAIGFSTDSPDSFQGWHSKGGNLFIFDEATGISGDIWKAARGCLTSKRDRILAIGNPTDPTSRFAFECRRRIWNVVSISAFDTPNVQQGREVIPGLVSREWVEEMRAECGSEYERHPDYVSRVLGQFPEDDVHALVPLRWVEAAFERWERLNDELGWRGQPDFGSDVARLGSAKTVVAESYAGQGCFALHHLPAQKIPRTAGDLLALARDNDALTIRVDADGLGAGVADIIAAQEPTLLREMRGGMASRATDSEGRPLYVNLRSEWFWTLRQRLDPDGPAPIALPPSDALRAQLPAIRWFNTPKGLKQIESKKDMVKRGMRSPDEADAVAYSLAMELPEPKETSLDLAALAAL